MGDRERDLHARGGLRDPLEARRPARRTRRGAPEPPARRELHRDRRQLRVRLLLVLLPRRQHPARGEAHRASSRRWRSSRATQPEFANVVAEGVAAPHHQHLFYARLDFDVDGAVNEVYEVDAEPLPPGPDNPWMQRVPRRRRRGSTPSSARSATIDPATVAQLADREPAVAQRPRPAGRLQARPDDDDADAARARRLAVGRRAGFARHNLWVTPYAAGRAARRRRVPEPARGRRRPARWTAPDRSLVDTDVVVWYTFGVTHFVRPEDWPVMPVEYSGFLLTPVRLLRPQPGARRAARRGALRARRLARARSATRQVDEVGLRATDAMLGDALGWRVRELRAKLPVTGNLEAGQPFGDVLPQLPG